MDIKKEIEQLELILKNLKAKASKQELFVILDAGHGGNHPKTGVYMTPANIGKRYYFTEFNFEIREGVVNRQICEKVATLLDQHHIDYEKIHHDYLDTSLSTLVQKANNLYSEKKQLYKKVILLSFHSNAFGMNQGGKSLSPKGISFWTSRSNTVSDKIADLWYKECESLRSKFENFTMRKDIGDGDFDWEANFKILYHTAMPAVLVENLFFTNHEDAKLLKSEAYQNAFAKCTLNMLQKV